MTPEQIRLECLKLVTPRDQPGLDATFFVGKAKVFEEYVNGQTKRGPGRPRNADKSKDPAD